jgi:hypothetical protein
MVPLRPRRGDCHQRLQGLCHLRRSKPIIAMPTCLSKSDQAISARVFPEAMLTIGQAYPPFARQSASYTSAHTETSTARTGIEGPRLFPV